MKRSFLCLMLTLTVCAGGRPDAEPRKEVAPAQSRGLELILLTDDQMVRLEWRVEVNGRETDAIWDESFAKLLAYYDRNGKGTLDEKEASRLPASFAFRQSMWRKPFPYSGPPLVWKTRDRDGDGKLTTAVEPFF